MTPEQKAVVLDYVTEWQTNDDPWFLFEWLRNNGRWCQCSKVFNPLCVREKAIFRRKPRTITVTMPVPAHVTEIGDACGFYVYFTEPPIKDTAVAAIREAMMDE